jgi:hypothetical protein
MTYDDLGRKKALCEGFLHYDPYDSWARMAQASYPDAKPADQLQAVRFAIRNDCINPSVARSVAQAAEDREAGQLLNSWLTDAKQALRQPEPARWADPLSAESLRLAVVLAGERGQPAEALDLAGQAAALLKYLSTDSRRSRVETVDMEVYLDLAWFEWLLEPKASPDCVQSLEKHLWELSAGCQDTYSFRMAVQFVTMLRLSQDRVDDARRALYLGNQAIQPQVVRRSLGVAYARLVALAGPRASPKQVQMWTRRGSALLGEVAWKQVLAGASSGRDVAWWSGVLSDR